MTAASILRAEAGKRILIKDGPYGTAIQAERNSRPRDYAQASTS
jgi:methionine synthase I (cobalamin-dependent)